MRLVVGLAIVLGLALGTTPASAFFKRNLDAPWCLAYSGTDGIVDCGFYTYEQCMETLWGVGGSCQPNFNTRYVEEPPPRANRKRRY